VNKKAREEPIKEDLMLAAHCRIAYSRKHSWKFVKKNPIRCNNVSDFIIPCLYKVRHVSGDTPPIIRSLKLH
jgi:hypothetical protein